MALRSRGHGATRASAASAASALVAVLVAAGAAHAELPAPRCTSGEAHTVQLDGGTVMAIAAARDAERTVIAARLFALDHGRRRTRVVVGELGASGEWTGAPRVVAELRGRVNGALEVDAREGVTRVVFGAGTTVRSVSVGDAPEHDVTVDLAPPVRGVDRVPLVARGPEGITLVWRRAETAVVQPFTREGPGASHRVQLPRQTVAIGAAGGANGDTALVVRTSARRYYVALVHADGRFTWTGDAPAGCERNHCPALALLPAPDGYVAAWNNRPEFDGLVPPGARALDTRGHIRSRAFTFIPMTRGVVVSGPRGEPLALQLGRPIVLRGGARPIALAGATPRDAGFPVFARAWTEGDALEVLSATRSGALTVARVECTPP